MSSSLRMLCPLHVVYILVLSGLTKQPLEAPNLSNSVQKNSTSSCATVDDMSSMYASRWAMLPKPSSPVLLLFNRLFALIWNLELLC